MKGGKREGAGRPKSDNKRVMVALRLPPDVVEFLKVQGESQSVVVENAIRLLMDKGA